MEEKIELQMARSSDNNFYLEIRGIRSRLMMFRIEIPSEKIADLISTRTLEVDSVIYSEKMDNWFKKGENKFIKVSTVGYDVFQVNKFQNWKREEVTKHEQDGWIADSLDKFNAHKYDSDKGTYEVNFRRWV